MTQPRNSCSAIARHQSSSKLLLLRRVSAAAALLLLGGALPEGGSRAAPVPAGSRQQVQGTAKEGSATQIPGQQTQSGEQKPGEHDESGEPQAAEHDKSGKKTDEYDNPGEPRSGEHDKSGQSKSGEHDQSTQHQPQDAAAKSSSGASNPAAQNAKHGGSSGQSATSSAGGQHNGSDKGKSEASASGGASPQDKARAAAIGRDGTEAPVGLQPGPRGAGAMSQNPTPHADAGKRIVPGDENPAGPSSPTRTTRMNAVSSNAGPTGAAGSSFSGATLQLPGTGRPAQTGPGTKLSQQALPLSHSQASGLAPNGYNPAEMAPIGKTTSSGSSAKQNQQEDAYHPAQVHGVDSRGTNG